MWIYPQIGSDAAKCAKIAPYPKIMDFLKNPRIFENFRKLSANSEKIKKIASRDSLEQGIVAVMLDNGTE